MATCIAGATKRVVDAGVACVGLVLLSPLIAVVGMLVRLKLGKPVFFRQVRPGLHGDPFTLVKFRTMRDATDDSGRQLADDDRMTSIGATLRRLSIDELPQLLNLLKGDLSLVGPRPLLMEYLPLYTPEQARRHEVRPGITGWAQVNGRNAITWEEKFERDVWYIDHWSLWLDTKILFMTAGKVFKREGISCEGVATMPKFTGQTELPGKN